MPKTRIGERFKKAPPPIDPGWGMILVRKTAMGLSLKELADKSGVGYESLRRYWNNPPITWSQKNREKILNTLGLDAELVIKERE